MSFLLFLLVTATLFIRPAEIVEDLQALPIYEWLIVSCLALSLGRIAEELQPARLRERPITLCVLGMLVAIALSHLSHFNFYSARECTIEFSKSVLYYLLLVANVNNAARLQTFLLWFLACIVIVALLAALQYHAVINIPSLMVLQQYQLNELTGELNAIPRLRGTGLFNDPNDLSMIMVSGIVVAVFCLSNVRTRTFALIWLAAIGLLGYDLLLTKSRGGFLAMIVGGGVVSQARWGTRRTCLLATGILPVLLMLGGRQADFGTAMEDDTGQERIQLWSQGLALFRQAPLFGIGQGQYAEQVGLVAHNSFVHCFTELGIFGGGIFLGLFLFPVVTIYRVRQVSDQIKDDSVTGLRPFVSAIVGGYGVSMLSLSRPYVAPTYLIVGLASAWLRLARIERLLPDVRVDRLMLKRMAAASFAFLAAIYMFVLVFARWTS